MRQTRVEKNIATRRQKSQSEEKKFLRLFLAPFGFHRIDLFYAIVHWKIAFSTGERQFMRCFWSRESFKGGEKIDIARESSHETCAELSRLVDSLYGGGRGWKDGKVSIDSRLLNSTKKIEFSKAFCTEIAWSLIGFWQFLVIGFCLFKAFLTQTHYIVCLLSRLNQIFCPKTSSQNLPSRSHFASVAESSEMTKFGKSNFK